MRAKWMAGAVAYTLLAVAGYAQETPPDRAKPTADQAKNNPADRDVMQKIRKAVMDDKSLSTAAHNVKIISQSGKVTLKGQVPSSDEKDRIEKVAREVAGAANVTNEITVKPTNKSN